MGMLFVLFLTVAFAGCPCPTASFSAQVADSAEVVRVRVSKPGVEQAAASGKGKTRVYAEVAVLDVFKGTCTSSRIELRQIVDSKCPTAAVKPGVYVILGAYEAGSRSIFFLDPCKPARDEASVKREQSADPAIREQLTPRERCLFVQFENVIHGTVIAADKTAASLGKALLGTNSDSAATLSDCVVSSWPEGHRTLVDPFDQATKQCFFKAEKPMAAKEDQVCADAKIGAGCSVAMSARTKLARAYRSTLSWMLAKAVGSKVVAETWPVFSKVGTNDHYLVGHCMEATPSLFRQIQEELKLPVIPVTRRKDRRFVELGTKKLAPFVEGIDWMTEVGPKGNVDEQVIVRGLLDKANVPCAPARKRITETLQEEVINSASLADLNLADASAKAGHANMLDAGMMGFIATQKGFSYMRLQKNCPTRETPGVDRLISDLHELHLLDSICGQTDRGLQNIFVRTPLAAGDVAVIGIDLDMSFGDLATLPNAQLPHLPPYISTETQARLKKLVDDRELIGRLIDLFPDSSRPLFFKEKVLARLRLVEDHVVALANEGRIYPLSEMSNHMALLNETNSNLGRWRLFASNYDTPRCHGVEEADPGLVRGSPRVTPPRVTTP